MSCARSPGGTCNAESSRRVAGAAASTLRRERTGPSIWPAGTVAAHANRGCSRGSEHSAKGSAPCNRRVPCDRVGRGAGHGSPGALERCGGAAAPLGTAQQDGAPTDGPQEPFLCTTEFEGLGQPIVDNQAREGTPVYPETETGSPDRTREPVGWSKRCQVDEVVEYRYRDDEGEVHTLPAGATELPADVAYVDTAELLGSEEMELGDSGEIPYLYRYQRGTLDETRFIYSIAMLVPPEEALADDGGRSTAHWNGRLVYSFGGGVGIGHSQGDLSDGDSQLDEALRLGHAVVYSSGTRTSVHYDLLLGGRVAEELKARFVEEYGEPLYTVGIGGSGGAIQQYVYAQNHPELLDALIPQYSYPDMTTQTINVGDCELLEHYMDVTDGDNARWRDWDQRKLLQGQNTIEGFESDWQELTGASGSSECIEGWRGATPLALNPTFGLATGMDDALLPYADELLARAAAGEPAVPEDFPDLGRLLRQSEDPQQWVRWTHWDDAAEAYGVDPESGWTRVPWDNTGVQYGLRSVAQGRITPEEFLDLNERIGSWKPGQENVPESCGMVSEMAGETLAVFADVIGMCEGDELDQYSARQMRLGAGDEPAPRTEGDPAAITNAFESGLEFDGRLARDVPIIDVRHYLEEELDMHNAHQSFVVRERIERAMGSADNQVVLFMDARPERDDEATSVLLTEVYRTMDEWVLAQQGGDGASAASVKPDGAVDGCFETDGTMIASGDDVWSGAVELVTSGRGAWEDAAPDEVDGVQVGDCAAAFPLHSTSRVVAGGPITNDVYKCHLKPLSRAVEDGDYGEWEPTGTELERLGRIFPDGVCDWSRRSVGYPGGESASGEQATATAAGETIASTDPSGGIPGGLTAAAALGVLVLLLGGTALASGAAKPRQ
ncbi:MAG: DUF6351 family protein [Microthrixaceae bacterium]